MNYQRAQACGACGYCQTARIRCDQARPCQQCVKKGRAAQCGSPRPKASAKAGAKEKDSGVNLATACPDYNILWE